MYLLLDIFFSEKVFWIYSNYGTELDLLDGWTYSRFVRKGVSHVFGLTPSLSVTVWLISTDLKWLTHSFCNTASHILPSDTFAFPYLIHCCLFQNTYIILLRLRSQLQTYTETTQLGRFPFQRILNALFNTPYDVNSFRMLHRCIYASEKGLLTCGRISQAQRRD